MYTQAHSHMRADGTVLRDDEVLGIDVDIFRSMVIRMSDFYKVPLVPEFQFWTWCRPGCEGGVCCICVSMCV